MRVGVLARGELNQVQWVHQLGFRSMEWVGFAESECGPDHPDWKPFAEKLAAELQSRDIRLSAIGALYANPLDSEQTEFARAVFRRAFAVASFLGVKTVAGFPGAVIETERNPRGGQVVYKPFEQFLPQLLAFWEPLADEAADLGLRIAFEHCPQGAYHLPLMGYNMLAQPSMWERLFNATRRDNLGLEWDPSHLICQFIDPVENVYQFGSRIFHVHAKDAFINEPRLKKYGICHPGVAEHRMPGLGQANWAEIVRALLLEGYDSDLNIEGWHDPVFRDHERVSSSSPTLSPNHPLRGKKLEETGLLIAKKTLELYTP